MNVRLLARGVLLLAALVLGACRSSDGTSIVVKVVSDDTLGIASVEMTAQRAGGTAKTASFPDPRNVVWVLTPAGSDKSYPIEVEARGVVTGGAQPVLSQRAVVAFRPGQRVEVTLSLNRACLTVVCDATRTCDRGLCVDPGTVGTNPGSLDGGTADQTPTPDAARPDGSTPDKAEGGQPEGGQPDGGQPDSGPIDGGQTDVAPQPRSIGDACTANADCASTHCADGVCCNETCGGSCQQCNTADMRGYCVPVAAGKPAPTGRTACAADAVATCKQTGVCDGKGACQLHPDGAVCKAATCDAATNTLTESRCDGAGTCKAATPLSCAPFRCKTGDIVCARTCAGNTDCDGQPCLANSCGKLKVGAVCAADADCELGFCTDGVCCNARCAGQCQSCNLSTSVGTCSNLRSGQPVGTRTACGGSGSCAGSCTGLDVCSFPGATVSCRAAGCDVATLTAAAACNGAGACPAVSMSACPNHLRCATGITTCLAQCATGADCVAGYYCAGTACALTKVNGTACTLGAECTSGVCADGVCCNRTCSGSCEACGGTGVATPGTCTFITGAPRAGHTPACAGTGTCASTCTGAGATCVFPATTVSCRVASCASGTGTLGANCDGAGNCPATSTKACTPFICGATACLATCTANSQCVTGAACVGGTCTTCGAGLTVCPNACANLATDGANCGACGHSCQGGTCAGSVCQPVALLNQPISTFFLLSAQLVGGNIYVFSRPSVGGFTGELWQIPVSGTGVGTKVCADGIPDGDIAVGAGAVFWVQPGATQGFDIVSTPLTACQPAAPTRLFAQPRSLGTDWATQGPFFDPATSDLVWFEDDNVAVPLIRVMRSATNGTNVRTLTMFSISDPFPVVIPPSLGGPNRLFWQTGTGLTAHGVSYISTTLAGSTPISLTMAAPGSRSSASRSIIANDTDVVWVSGDSTSLSFTAPLPSGVPGGGAPARFPNASSSVSLGVMDATTFYGIASANAGAISKCTIANCVPTVLVPGQSAVRAFLQDATTLYWVSVVVGLSPTSPSSISVSKLAK